MKIQAAFLVALLGVAAWVSCTASNDPDGPDIIDVPANADSNNGRLLYASVC